MRRFPAPLTPLVRGFGLLLLGLLMATPTGLAQEAAAPAPALQATFDRIATDVVEIRGLELTAPIDQAFMTRAELQVMLEEELAESYPPEAVAADQRVLVAFGLLPAETDLGQLYIDLLSGGTLGFYDPDTNEMVLIGTEEPTLSALNELAYAHEVVHALQDQHLGLGDLLGGLEQVSDDEALAITALFEGDATVAETFYLDRAPGLLVRSTAELLVSDIDFALLQNAPPILVDTLTFPYAHGAGFVQTLYDQGGWDAVNAAYADPPTTTEQVLHPAKYLSGEQPADVTLPEVQDVLDSSWELVDENDFGEFAIRLLLQGQGASSPAAVAAAAGWNGDYYGVWANGSQTALLWQSAWDSPEDATAFATALRAYDEARFGIGYVESDQPDVVQLSSSEQVTLLSLDGSRVTYAVAPTPELAAALLARAD